MKHKLKKFVPLAYLFLATFLYYSCTYEKEYINEKNHQNVIFKEKTFDEVLQIPIFNEAYQKLVKKKGNIAN